MDAISIVVLILACPMGFSIGAAAKAGKSVILKPHIIDLVLVSVICAGAIYSKFELDLNRWLVVLAWVVFSIVVGILAIWPRRLHEVDIFSIKATEETPNGLVKGLWRSWVKFSRRTSTFHGRIILSLFFFTAVPPFALAIRFFSDPLGIKNQGKKPRWLSRTDAGADLEQLRRQF